MLLGVIREFEYMLTRKRSNIKYSINMQRLFACLYFIDF